MNKILALTLAASLAPFAASAAEVTLAAPMHGATLQGEAADMSVYYLTDDSQAFHVVAVYADKAAPGERHQIMMQMNDGDAVRFALPHHPAELYSFARNGENITVKSEPAPFRPVGKAS
ncbi:hypothetical protein [Paracoccus ravus]|uniref:hypothetical protein n=1 Tax=Paracoccus ravus TaxID=2447760 RepID=UPI00106DE520|nr:hypothetical protein [Paracoccus ravus]